MATAALTVGAVDAQDQLADFSSRGPRYGDYAMKPDITAPGVDIVAARAAGTALGEPVGQWYTSVSGTSMATPHVAGAAAIMAQRWPSWTPGRIKAVLMGTADPNPDLSVYAQGGGRLDVGQAVGQRLIARRANLDFGWFRYPQTAAEPVTKPLLLQNLGAAATTVDLNLELEAEDGGPAPAGMVAVTPSRLTLAAGASATAQVTVDVAAGAPGRYSGAVVATPATGPAIRTPLGFYKEPERYDLTLRAIGRDGQPASFADAGVLNVDNGELFADFLVFDEDATLTLRVAPGNYHIMGFVAGADFGSVSMVGDPEVQVTGATTYALDARRAEPVRLGIQGVATDPTTADIGWTRLDEPGTYGLASSFSGGPELASGGLFAEPTDEPVRVGQFEVELRTRLIPAGAGSAATTPTLWDLLQYGGEIPDPPDYVLSAAERARLARIDGHYRALNDDAEYADVRIGFAPLQFFAGGSYEPIAVPRTRAEYVSPAPITWLHDAAWSRGEAFIDFYGPAFVQFEPGQQSDEWWFGAPLHAKAYGERDAESMFVGVADLRDTGGHDGWPWEWSEDPVATQALRLYRDGRLLASAQEPFLQAAVPAASARYRLERDLDMDGLTRLANVSRTRWWFDSEAPAGQDAVGLPPLLGVDYQAAPLGGRNGAVAGQPVTVDLDVARQEGAEPSEVVATHLWLSTDDGGSWRLPAPGQGRPRPLPGGDPRLPAPLRHLGQPAHLGPRRRRQPHPPDADPGVPGPLTGARGPDRARRPAVAAPCWRASRPKASTGPRAPVPSTPEAAARWAPQASSRAVRV